MLPARKTKLSLLVLLVFATTSVRAQWDEEEPAAHIAANPDRVVAADALDGAALDGAALDDLDSLLNADLEQLARTDVVVPAFDEQVTSVARQESTVGRSPAAIYVLTGEDIRRSGARNLPEALRLVPGVQVARIDSNKWAISIRGFNQRFANKLLVQIDGRTVYTPLFGGVFWDVQDVLIEDIDRVEVIRGPGASVWGANAVNGIINVMTKHASESQGVYVEGGSGTERTFGAARVGGQTEKASWRAYGKFFEFDHALSTDGAAADDWRLGHGGFRVDWQLSCCDTLTFQGDYYDGDSGDSRTIPTLAPPFRQRVSQSEKTAGGNALLRWNRSLSDTSELTAQLYYDRTERNIVPASFRENRDTLDFDIQHRFQWHDYHNIIWGGGYRNTRSATGNTDIDLRFSQPTRADDTFNVFVQDEMTLVEDAWYLTLGCKFSWNDYTGYEYQPTARLLYTPSERQSWWASVSRAVRTPARTDDDLQLVQAPVNFPAFPTFPIIRGNRDSDSEDLLAWELGVRGAPTDDIYFDVALFYNQYNELIGVQPGLPGFDPFVGSLALPFTLDNAFDAETLGGEIAVTLQMLDHWRLRSGYSFLDIDVHAPAGIPNGSNAEGESPRNQLFVHSSWDVGCDWQFDVVGRYTDSLSQLSVPSYFELDSRLAWVPNDSFEFAVVGRNLLDNATKEFSSDEFTGLYATEVRREAYGTVTWRY